MKTRIYSALVVALLSFMTANAQIKEKGIFAEVNISSDASYENSSYTILSPAVGYKFSNRWTAGFRVQFELGDHGYFTHYTPYIQYFCFASKRLKGFIEAQPISIAEANLDGGQSSYIEAGFTFGATYALCRNLNLTARYLYIGYNDFHRRDYGPVLGKGRIIADAGRFMIGLQAIF